jgi:hypothetical protein
LGELINTTITKNSKHTSIIYTSTSDAISEGAIIILSPALELIMDTHVLYFNDDEINLKMSLNLSNITEDSVLCTLLYQQNFDTLYLSSKYESDGVESRIMHAINSDSSSSTISLFTINAKIDPSKHVSKNTTELQLCLISKSDELYCVDEYWFLLNNIDFTMSPLVISSASIDGVHNLTADLTQVVNINNVGSDFRVAAMVAVNIQGSSAVFYQSISLIIMDNSGGDHIKSDIIQFSIDSEILAGQTLPITLEVNLVFEVIE